MNVIFCQMVKALSVFQFQWIFVKTRCEYSLRGIILRAKFESKKTFVVGYQIYVNINDLKGKIVNKQLTECKQIQRYFEKRMQQWDL